MLLSRQVLLQSGSELHRRLSCFCLQVDVPRYTSGDVVCIMDDMAEVMKLQQEYGGWNEDMANVSCMILNVPCLYDMYVCVCVGGGGGGGDTSARSFD